MKLREKSSRSDEFTSAPRAMRKTVGLSHKAKPQAVEKTMFLKPLLSEKTYALGVARNVYVFQVPGNANKHTVADAVGAQFEVTVVDVNIANTKGKAKRTVRKGGRPVAGRRSDVKKAFVTLKQGDKLPFFEAEEEKEKKQAETQAKVAQAAEKAAKKAAKKEEK